MEDWKQRSKILVNQIHAVDPYYVPTNECRFIGQISYADITAGRTNSPSSRNCSPYRQQRDNNEASSSTAAQILRPTVTRVQKLAVESSNEPQVSRIERTPRSDVNNLDKPVSQLQTEIHVQMMDDKDTIGMKESEQKITIEMIMSRRGRSPTRKTILSRAKEPVIIQEEKIDEYDNPQSDTNPKQEARVESARSNSNNILAPCQDRRGRSPSPMWVPGSTSYADILRGRMQMQMNITPTEPSRQEMISLSEESHQDQVPHTEQIATSETQPIAEMQQIESTQEMEDVPIEDIHITEVYCQSPEISTEKIEEEQTYDKPTSTNWADEALEDYNVLQHVETYENVQPQSVEIYDYIIPEPMPELVNFIGSQLGTYPVSAYVYAPSAHQQLEVQQLDAMNLSSYNASLAYASEHYVSQAAYLPTPNVYQQSSMQQQPHCPSSDMKHTTPMLEDAEKQIPPIQQSNIIKDVVIESDDKPEQEEPVDVSIVEASRISSKMEEKDVLQGKGTLNNIETKGQTFSYAQILSQGLSSRVIPTHIDKSPAASHQSKERSKSPNDTLSSYELSPGSKLEQDSQLSIAKVEQPRQFKQNNWDTMKKREVKKKQQQTDDKLKQMDEKKSRKPIDKPKEKQKKEKLSPPLQLMQETRKEPVIEKINDNSTKKEEKSVQEKQTLDSIETNPSQEKKRKQKKKKMNKLEGDEIDKALKEIEDMDKQKAKSQKDKSKEQNKDQNRSRDSTKTEETWEKSKNEIDKKQNVCSEKSKQSEKSKGMTKMQDRLANQAKVKDQDMPEDNTEFKVKETLKDQSRIIDNNVHTLSEKSDVKAKRKNKVNKNIKRQTQENLENKIQSQLDTSSSSKKDTVNIRDESNTIKIVNSLVIQKTKSEDMNERTIVPIKMESTKKHKDTAEEENNETKEIIETKPADFTESLKENEIKKIIEDKPVESIDSAKKEKKETEKIIEDKSAESIESLKENEIKKIIEAKTVESIELPKEDKKEIKNIIETKPIEFIESPKENKKEIKTIIKDKPIESIESLKENKNEIKKIIENKPVEFTESPKKGKNETKKLIESKSTESIKSPKKDKNRTKKIIEDKPVESIESPKEEKKESKKIIEDEPVESIESLKEEKKESKKIIEDKSIEFIKSTKKEKETKKIIEDKPVESIKSLKKEKNKIKRLIEDKPVESIESSKKKKEIKKIIENKSLESIDSLKEEKNETKKIIEDKPMESIKSTEKEKETKKIIENKPLESIKSPKKEKNKTKKIIEDKPVESIESSKEEKKEIKKIIENKSVESIDSPKEEKNEIKKIIENKFLESIDSSKEDKNKTKKTIETKPAEFIESSKKEKNKIEKLIEDKAVESIESPINGKMEDAKSSISNKIDNKINDNIKDKPKSRKKDKTSKSKIRIDSAIDLKIKEIQQPLEGTEIEIKSDTKDSKDSTDAQICKEHKKETYDNENDNLKSEQLSSTGKALIIEKMVTTVTTTTTIPGSAKIKPPDVKSIKSVEILENIPLPKIVGSKVTELISLRPETVEASLTTTYARISNDSPVDSCPVQSGQALMNLQEIDLTSSMISTENIVMSDESSLFGSMQDRTCDILESRDASVKFHDMPVNFVFEKKEEHILDIDNNMKEQTVLLNESIIEQKNILKTTTYEQANKDSDTKGKKISVIDTSLQEDNTIESEEINNSIEKDNIALAEISQVAANISVIEKEKQVGEYITDKVKAEDILRNENKERIVPSHLLELVKPYALDRHVYNLAESNFYRYFKTVKVVEEPQLPAVIQTRPESIERIVQESVMRPTESTNQETFNDENRRHALIIDAPKYPSINFYELESQWVIAKFISEKSRSALSDDSEISMDSVIEKIERKVEKETCITPLKEDTITINDKPIITETNENRMMSRTPQITTITEVQVSENISKLLTDENVTEKPANVQQPIYPVSDDSWMNILDEPIVIENDFDDASNPQEIKEIVSEKLITEKSEEIENEEIKKEEVTIENYEKKIEREEANMEEQIEKGTENKRTKCKKRENTIQKAEVKIEEKETESKEMAIEKRENEVSNSTEIAVKDEYHAGIKNIQNEISYTNNKDKQDDKTKNQSKKKKHIKDGKIKDAKSKAESKNRTNEETKTDIAESDLPARRSNLEEHKISENETNSATLETEKSLKDNAESNFFPESKRKEQEAIDVAQQKSLPKHEEQKIKSGKKSKKQNEKSEIQERSPTKRECKIKQDDNVTSSKATESSIESSISEVLPIVRKQQNSKDDLPKFDCRLNPNAKSWAAVVGTKGVTEVTTVIPLKNDSLSIPSDRPSSIVCQDVTDSAADITEELQTAIANDSCETPPKQETPVEHSSPSEQQINKFNDNEESRAIPTDEKLITKKSIEPPKQFKEGNKSYAEVAASFRHASSQAAQEEMYVAKPISLKSDEIIDTSSPLVSIETHEDPDTEKSQSSLEQDNKQNNEVVMQISSEEPSQTIIATAIPQKESISWIEEVEKETSSDVSLDASDTKGKEANAKTEICTWAAIVGKKSVETSEVNISNLEQNLCKSDQVIEQRPLLPIQIYVEKTPDQEPIENLVQVDEQGFMEFVNRKELRHRRSRSRSRSIRRDNGHAIIENTDSIDKKEIKTLNAETQDEDVRDKEETENDIEQLPRKDEEAKAIDIENDELAKTIKNIAQEKPSEKIDISKNKDRNKQKKDKEMKKQSTQGETQHAESKIAQRTKSEQGETAKGRRNKSKKNRTTKDQTKQQAEINEEKESKHVGEPKEEQESADKNNICGKIQLETLVIDQEMQSIIDQPIKETQLIIDTANTQEDKCTYVEAHPITEQSNMTKSKKKSKNKKGKVVSEQVTENISDTDKKAVILGDSEEKIESTREPKLEDVMEIKLEEAIATDICNASASLKNEETPSEENNKQEDVKQQALDKVIEMGDIVQKAFTDELKNTESACKEPKKTEENAIEQSEVCKITKAEKRKQKKKAKTLSRNGVIQKEEHVEDVAQNKSDLSVYDASYDENITAEEMIRVTEKSLTETKEPEKYKELDLLVSPVEKKMDEESIKIKDLPSVEKKHKQKQKSSRKQNAKIDSKKESPRQKDEIRFTKPDDITVKVSAVDEAINLTRKVTDSNAESDLNSSKNEENILSIEIKSEKITETFDEERKDEIKHEDKKQIETAKILEDNDAAKSTIDSEDTETTSLTTKEQLANKKETIVHDDNAMSLMIVAKQAKSQAEEYHSKPDDTPQSCDVIVDNNIIKMESALTSDNVEMNKSADKIVIDTASAINDALQIDTSGISISEVTELFPPLDESSSVTVEQSVEDKTKHVASVEQENADLSVKSPKVQFYIADEILVLSPENRRKDVPATSLLREEAATDLDNSRFLSIDCGFWLDKRSYHEAERDHFENLALHMNASRGSKHDNRDRPHDRDDDRDGDNSGGSTGGKPRDSHGDSRSFPDAPQTERMIADLPGGICSWSDYSTYLSSESERTPDCSLSLGAIENTRLDSALSLDYSLPSDIQSPYDLLSLSPPHIRDPQTESHAESVVDAEVTPRECSVISSNDLQSPDCPSTCIRSPTFHLRPQSKLHLGRESRERSVQRCSPNREMGREMTEGEAEKRIRRIQVRSSSQPVLGLILVRV